MPGILAPTICLAAALLFSACAKHRSAVEKGNLEQVLHRGVFPDISDLDPHLALVVSDHNVLFALFEGLVSEDPVDLHPVPGVAERWEISADHLTYTFFLRDNARWSNGASVTANDFVASFRRLLSPELASSHASLLFVVRNAEAYYKRTANFADVGIKALDDRRLSIVLDRPTPLFLSLLAYPAFFPVHLPSIEKLGSATARENPWTRPAHFVGNGPFTLAEWSHGQVVVVKKSPAYWDSAQVRLREIHFHVFESRDAEERAFRSGQIHITEALPVSKIDTYRRDKPDLLRIDPYLGTEFYRFNVNRPFFKDVRVRKALALAVNRTALAEKILRGGQLPARAFTPPDTAGYTPAGHMRDDFSAARDLLKEAGFPGGQGAPIVELLFNTSESHRAVAEAIQEMWRRELGINLRLINQEYKMLQSARRTSDFQLLRSVWVADYADPLSFLEIWTSSSNNNYTGWSDPEYDRLISEAARTMDTGARHAILQQAEKLLLEAAPFIPLYHYKHIFLLQPSVKNWHPTALDHHPYKHVYLQN